MSTGMKDSGMKSAAIMSMDEFVNAVAGELANYLPDYAGTVVVEPIEVIKVNDQRLRGITIRESGREAAMTLYLDDAYERYCSRDDKDITRECIMRELAVTFVSNRFISRPEDVSIKWEDVRDSLTLRLVEKKRNKAFLEDRPYSDAGSGLALVYDINMGKNRNSEWRANLTNHMLESLNISPEDLLDQAMKSAQEIEPAMLSEMSQNIFGLPRTNLLEGGAPHDMADAAGLQGGMYVLTNKSATFGASAMFYPDVKERIAEILGEGYFALPSSLHEMILVPDSSGVEIRQLQEMVREANRTVVEPKDILSDNVFHFSRGDGFEGITAAYMC